MKSYHRRLLKMARRDPKKLATMFRLKTAKIEGWQDRFKGQKNVVVPPPMVVSIRLNYNCNLRCAMCNQWGDNGVFVKTPDRMVKREMTTADVKGLIDQLAEFRPYIYFTGGEPLINRDIIEIIRYASSKHLVTSMSTNSTHLKERAKDLIESGLDYLYTSLDSPLPVEDDIIRKTAKGVESQPSAADAIRYFIRLRDEMGVGLPIVQTQTTLVKENTHLIYQMAEFLHNDLKPDIWGMQLCVFTTEELNKMTTKTYEKNFNQDQVGWAGFVRDFPDMNFKQLDEEIKKVLANRKKWHMKLRPYKPLGMKGFDMEKYFTRPDVHAVDDPLTCMNPYVFAQVQPNGDVAFCGSQPDFTIGNVRQERFLDLWSNQRSMEWREFLTKQLFESCKRCFTLYEYAHFSKVG